MKKCFIMLVLAMLLFVVSASAQPKTDTFFITVGAGNVIEGGGSGFNNGEWYVYPSGWINEWFYDHPFDPERGKVIHIEFDWIALDPLAPTNITVAINWSTPEWSGLGYGTTQPPLPGVDELLYIVRATVLAQRGLFPVMQYFSTDFTIWPYNPEWVSIDVMGYNFVISNGSIIHDCVLGTEKSNWGSIKASFK
ncbi:MAG: hypothetical protein WC674_06355 [Candidatus Krumholzibacteriia bacterium]